MKNRHGFVSNSSSSSFVIRKEDISEKQIRMISNHVEESEDMLDMYSDDGWGIEEDEFIIKGSTSMDNFDMSEFLNRIGVPNSVIKWDY
jgi:hypothetical protein